MRPVHEFDPKPRRKVHASLNDSRPNCADGGTSDWAINLPSMKCTQLCCCRFKRGPQTTRRHLRLLASAHNSTMRHDGITAAEA